jgi:hypothetical protein
MITAVSGPAVLSRVQTHTTVLMQMVANPIRSTHVRRKLVHKHICKQTFSCETLIREIISYDNGIYVTKWDYVDLKG